jgi:hypothetical protein
MQTAKRKIGLRWRVREAAGFGLRRAAIAPVVGEARDDRFKQRAAIVPRRTLICKRTRARAAGIFLDFTKQKAYIGVHRTIRIVNYFFFV